MNTERPVVFNCAEQRLLGIMHEAGGNAQTGMVIVVGGPQYRVGSHRQFVLMARAFAAAGIAVLRFDYRGMGDAEGEQRNFEKVEEDIRTAVNCLMDDQPQLKTIVLFGLCDAASAILMYVPSDSRIDKLVLLNPWVHTEAGEAKAYLKNYYLQRLMQRSFWKKLLTGQFKPGRSLREAGESIRTASGREEENSATVGGSEFIEQMRLGLDAFKGSVLTVISGRDLTAAQFSERLRSNRKWAKTVKQSRMKTLAFAKADHTFSDKSQLKAAIDGINQWLS